MLESFLFQTTIDVDDKEYVDKAIEKARELNCSDTIWNGALLHLEYSARKTCDKRKEQRYCYGECIKILGFRKG